jgi:transcriptional regulator with XRE-family HTH domain
MAQAKNDLFIKMKLAKELITYRTDNDKSIRQMEELTGVDKTILFKIETGFMPSAQDLYVLSSLFMTSMSSYFKEKSFNDGSKKKHAKTKKEVTA